MGLPPLARAMAEAQQQATSVASGRIYHDEHFNPGTLVPNGAGAAGAFSANGDFLMKKDTLKEMMGTTPRAFTCGSVSEALRSQYTQGGTAVPVSVHTPMPKWPAGHQSAAFEAVVQKNSLILSPAEIYAECAHAGEEKAKYPCYKLAVLSILAGAYVGFGYSTCLYVGGNLSFAPAVVQHTGTGTANVGLFKLIYGAFGFPFGFMTIMVCGAELYTSLCAYMTAAWFERKVSLLDVLRMLTVAWVFNYIGCAAMAGLFAASDIFEHNDYTLLAVAEDKVSHSWGATFVKGIFANWLVAFATWMANAAQDMTGKFIGVFLPISAFAAMGFEHCIANQFLFTLAYARGAHISASKLIWSNLIPATLGNYVGGGLFLAGAYACAYGGTPKRMGDYYDEEVAPKMPWAKKGD